VVFLTRRFCLFKQLNYEMDQTDEQLVTDYIKGNEESLNLLIKRYLKPIYNFAINYVGDDGEAQDVTQEVFVKVWRYIKRFDTNRKFKTWIFEITKNTAFDHLKKKKPLLFSKMVISDDPELLFENTISDDAPTAPEMLDEAMTREQVMKAISRLSPDYRAVLNLRLVNDLNFQEISDVLRKPLNTVKSQYRRAVALLRRELGDSP